MQAPRLAVVVLSHGDEPLILGALGSLAAQEVPLEIVVSHSGKGRTPQLVAAAHPGVRVVEAPARRLPGAARNAGVAATTAPFVAFLAADCEAQPGWAAGRLARHEAGAAAVASAMAAPGGPSAALASHLLQHWSRMPHRLPRPPQRFGVSYSRALLDELGGFRADLAFAEDAELNARVLAAGIAIEWAPDVLLAHAYPQTAGALAADAFARSRRRAAVGNRHGRRLALAGRALAAPAAASATALAPGSAVTIGSLVRALPQLAIGSCAGVAGALAGAPPEPGALAELRFHRFARGHSRRAAGARSSSRTTPGAPPPA
jgi:GT2 family glycosyltransferase